MLLPKNQKEAFLHYLSNMDISMVNTILDDNLTYMKVSKETFTNKLEEKIETFKEYTDTELKITTGECTSKDCNLGCKGYAFVGNCSGLHLDLMIDVSNEKITDIFQCTHFKADNEPLEEYNQLYLSFKVDEEVDFQPSLYYLNEKQKFDKAVEELVKKENSVLDLADATKWLIKHKELEESIDIFSATSTSRDKFTILYSFVSRICEISDFREEAETALDAYVRNNICKDDTIALTNWLMSFERLGTSKLRGLTKSYFNNEEEFETGYVKLHKNYNILINVKDFDAQITFINLFNSYYWNILNKHNTLSDEEINRIINEDDGLYKIDSLKFHLERSGLK